MSPALFLLCIEYLSRLLKVETGKDIFNFHPKCQGAQITHLAFADDLMPFSYGDIASVDILMTCLETFEGVSGLSLNPAKSSIFLAGVKDDRKRSILERVGFPEGTFPVRYLGIPLAPTSVSVKDFSPFTDAIDHFIQKWGHHTLSYAGKVELIRSVIQGVEGFWFQVFPMHDAVLRKIQSSCTQFFWGGRSARVAWDDICTPKLEGGLGLMDIWKWNVALLTRAIWHFLRQSDTIWVQFVNTYYLKGISFWDYSPRNRDSFLFKRLCSIRNQLFSHFGGVEGTIEGLYRCCEAGRFCTNLIYEALRVPNPTYPWMRIIWRPFIPPKFSFTLWLSCRKRLATRDSLRFMNLDDVSCIFCRNDAETQRHFFFSCPFTSAIWCTIRTWLGIRRQMTTLESAIKWITKEHGGKGVRAKAIILALCVLVHEIWRARNGAAFDQDSTSPEVIVARVKLATYRILIRLYPTRRITF
ncbi:reverse transcriptase [Lithospermum erythrorhizon]|uniref:Reverse transcriptase n=1 Tax=Lithospermum erythrorhizon TaxID=34254 RepID=A0AAV3QBR3_LITER